MINVKAPNPIFLENNEAERAILLLHSFTGTVRDVKLLATKLHKAGFTCSCIQRSWFNVRHVDDL